MHAVTYRSRKNFSFVSVVVIDQSDLRNQIKSVHSDIVQTAYKRRYVSSPCFCCQQCLTCCKYKCTVGSDSFFSKIFDCFYTIFDHRYFHHDLWVKLYKFFTFFYHSGKVGRNSFCTHVSVDDFAYCFVMFFYIFITAYAFFGHKRWICCNTVKYTKVLCFLDLFQICRINKEFHN